MDNDVIEIKLAQGQNAILDRSDIDLADMNWKAMRRSDGKTSYVKRAIKKHGKTSLECLHRVILSRMLNRPLKSREWVDHINGDALDNRRCNLRLSTPQQNQFNKEKQCNNKSGYKGVCSRQRKSSIRWFAKISYQSKSYHLGVYDTAEEAARAYDRAAIQLHGEFANLNFK